MKQMKKSQMQLEMIVDSVKVNEALLKFHQYKWHLTTILMRLHILDCCSRI